VYINSPPIVTVGNVALSVNEDTSLALDLRAFILDYDRSLLRFALVVDLDIRIGLLLYDGIPLTRDQWYIDWTKLVFVPAANFYGIVNTTFSSLLPSTYTRTPQTHNHCAFYLTISHFFMRYDAII
jgi:hypothetical protein